MKSWIITFLMLGELCVKEVKAKDIKLALTLCNVPYSEIISIHCVNVENSDES